MKKRQKPRKFRKFTKGLMLKQLQDIFPYITKIREDRFTGKLMILTKEENITPFYIWIELAKPNDKHPYTKETLEKAIKEYPEECQKRRSEVIESQSITPQKR